jgi:arsenite-transporting ATPase
LNNITVLRLYLKYLRNLAEKTDLGRLAGPSLVSLVDEALSLSGSKYNLNRKTSAEIWDSLETMLMVNVIHASCFSISTQT